MSEVQTRKDEEGEGTIAGLINKGFMTSHLHKKRTHTGHNQISKQQVDSS
jgi:hypothetical protein